MNAKFNNRGGNYINLIGAKWRVYYFAHLDTISITPGEFVFKGTTIGKVGNTGNAVGKQDHLHFSIITLFPYFWLYDRTVSQGNLRMFYLNPEDYFYSSLKN